jgi:type I restriction enzyme S subunit
VRLLDCDHKTPEPALAGYPYIAIPDIRDGRLDLSAVRCISRADYEEWTRKTKPQGGDIIVTRRGRVGDTAVIPPGLECAIGQNLVILRSDGLRVDQSYLRWALQGPLHQRQVQKYLNVGAVFDSLNCRDIPKFEISVPPVAEQRAIARALGALDDKIDLNRRMNETLESMARAIFKSWFVDFDPVRAKAEGRQPAGMDADTGALFPATFQRSEAGTIPRGWTTRPLDEIAHFLNGLAMQRFPPRGDDDLPVIKIADLRRGDTVSSDRAGGYIPREYIVEDGDLLFSWSGSLEACIWAGGRGALNQHLFKVTSTEYPSWFVYRWIMCHLPDFRAIAAGKATTMGHIQRHHLHQALTVVPPQMVLSAANEALSPIDHESLLLKLESYTLSALRDALLPKLLSGEVRLRDVASVIEANV